MRRRNTMVAFRAATVPHSKMPVEAATYRLASLSEAGFEFPLLHRGGLSPGP